MAADRLSATLSALADPTRRAILARLARGEASVTELAKPFDMSQPAISKHLKVLERAGLISRGRDAQFRPCRLEAERLRQATEWMARYQRFWEESFEDVMDGKFLEVVANERLVFAAKLPDDVDVHTTVTFAEHAGKTSLSVLQKYSHATDATRGARAGWTATLDQLAQHLQH